MRGWLAAAAAFAATGVAFTTIGTGTAALGATVDNLFGSTAPASHVDSDASSVTVGVQVRAKMAGSVTAVRYYSVPDSTGEHLGGVFSQSGTRLAQASFGTGSSSGWRSVTLPTPVDVDAGQVFTVAVSHPQGHYPVDDNFDWPLQSTAVTGLTGVYQYGDDLSFPTKTFRTSNYFVDLSFLPDDSPAPMPTATQPSPTRAAPAPAPTIAGPASNTLEGWELTASNVGLARFGLSCDNLPAYNGSSKPARGARISNVRIAANLDLSNGDIEIDKSCIRPTRGDNRALVSNDVCGSFECVVTSPSTVTIRDSELDGSVAPQASIKAACGFRGVGTLQRNYIHGMDSGICFFGTGFSLNALAEQNYVTGLRNNPGAHREAATIRDFRIGSDPARSARLINNRFDCEGDDVTGGLFIQPTWVDIANVTVSGNYLEGDGYNLYLENKGGVYTNLRATNNRFRPDGWGASVVASGAGWAQWSDNYLFDPSKPDGKGAVVRS